MINQADRTLYTAAQEAFHSSQDLTATDIKNHMDAINNAWDAYQKSLNHALYFYLEHKVKMSDDDTKNIISVMKKLGGYPESCLALEKEPISYAKDTATMETHDARYTLLDSYNSFMQKYGQCMGSLTPEQQQALSDNIPHQPYASEW
ncbi:hypothetical protein B9G54_02765 [Alloscardovia macacae]|uniref:Uncharacterized protein n=1 Tax=Alloscardovia macacae TaxID=1160091 RepID=A0A1Y2SZZ5_9BIFI|nr:hypothetical protein [Alloscardovia macacae]OTA26967.1 hypothetical protein B9G54_02765 [Alloscardovia macacae]OTA30045.1 hypothetical protein B9T39_01385 [Alloscardovia macacae]